MDLWPNVIDFSLFLAGSYVINYCFFESGELNEAELIFIGLSEESSIKDWLNLPIISYCFWCCSVKVLDIDLLLEVFDTFVIGGDNYFYKPSTLDLIATLFNDDFFFFKEPFLALGMPSLRSSLSSSWSYSLFPITLDSGMFFFKTSVILTFCCVCWLNRSSFVVGVPS